MSNNNDKILFQLDTLFNKKIELHEISLENEVALLRIRVREGQRFTVIDLDPIAAKDWGEAMIKWAKSYSEKKFEN